MDPNYKAPPFNPLPPVAWLLVLPIAAVELVLSVTEGLQLPSTIGWRQLLMNEIAFTGPLFDRMVAVGDYAPQNLMRLFSYMFVQWNAAQGLFVCALGLAMAKFVGEVFRMWAVLVVFFGGAAVGAVAYGGLLDIQLPLVGGYPGVYALIGAFTYILWTRLGALRVNRGRAFLIIGALMFYQVVFGAIQVWWYGVLDYYWVAELAAFAAGFGLSFLVSPGGWQNVLARLRQR